jgi:hypothetical protein
MNDERKDRQPKDPERRTADVQRDSGRAGEAAHGSAPTERREVPSRGATSRKGPK